MGKGGYLGGGTIIGPRTPGWFSPNPVTPVENEAGRSDDHDVADAPTKRLSRHQRRKRARMAQAQRTPTPQHPAKKPLTPLADRQISQLRISIRGREREIDRLRGQLETERADLQALLHAQGLPIGR